MSQQNTPWHAFATPILGKSVRAAARILKHGGSALPGQVVEKVDPGFLARTLGQLKYGVVLVSGTNGKTTTTRMVTAMLRDMGLKVFSNPTGSNFTRGVVSALLNEVSVSGRLDADIAVLELDEAYAVHFVQQVRPQFSLLLNVMRDQLDRFGEIDNTANLLAKVAQSTTGTVILNREDRRIAALADQVRPGVAVKYFGLDASLRAIFPNDDALHAESTGADTAEADATRGSFAQPVTADVTDQEGHPERIPADVVLTRIGDHQGEFLIDGSNISVALQLEGIYNIFNAAAAAATVRAVMAHTELGRADNASLAKAMGQVTPAFGRGEVIDVNGVPVELLLVKNPMGFRMSLASFPPQGHETMIAICDEYADGRDMSWLWDVDFASLRETGVAMVSGTRAWDMALRLEYDGVQVDTTDVELEAAVERFVTSNPEIPKHMYCTYTAMLRARAQLAKMTEVPDAGVGR